MMASRVLYGMAKQGLVPAMIGRVGESRQTPTRATAVVTAAVVSLILFFPLVELARLTSLVTLGVFTMVNAALFLIGGRQPGTSIARFRWVGFVGAVASVALATWQVVDELA